MKAASSDGGEEGVCCDWGRFQGAQQGTLLHSKVIDSLLRIRLSLKPLLLILSSFQPLCGGSVKCVDTTRVDPGASEENGKEHSRRRTAGEQKEIRDHVKE